LSLHRGMQQLLSYIKPGHCKEVPMVLVIRISEHLFKVSMLSKHIIWVCA
jgi:hypothetical protein